MSGPDLYSQLVDTLLRTISLPRWCFADDIKFFADVTLHSCTAVQTEIEKCPRGQMKNRYLHPRTNVV